MEQKDINHLKWIYERLKNVHYENEYYDYMTKFSEIINSLNGQENKEYLQIVGVIKRDVGGIKGFESPQIGDNVYRMFRNGIPFGSYILIYKYQDKDIEITYYPEMIESFLTLIPI